MSSDGLSYSKVRGDGVIHTIPIKEMLAVERVDETAFNMKFVSLYNMLHNVAVIMSLVNIVDVTSYSIRASIVSTGKEQCGSNRMVNNHTPHPLTTPLIH